VERFGFEVYLQIFLGLVPSYGNAVLVGKGKKVVPVYPVLAAREFKCHEIAFLNPS